MKKRVISFLIYFLFIFFVHSLKAEAQHNRRPFCGFSVKSGYYGYKPNFKPYIKREAQIGDDSGIPDVVQEIKKQLQFNNEIVVFIAAKEGNCYATLVDGRRVLIADQYFLNQVNKSSGTDWAAISVIAHEIGHHIAGFNRHDNQQDDELDADYWSGFVLNKLGASKDASTKCIMKFGTDEDTNTHPNKYKRAEMIKKGWDDASNGTIDYTKCRDCGKSS